MELPLELVEMIVSHITEYTDLVNLAAVSKRFFNLVYTRIDTIPFIGQMERICSRRDALQVLSATSNGITDVPKTHRLLGLTTVFTVTGNNTRIVFKLVRGKVTSKEWLVILNNKWTQHKLTGPSYEVWDVTKGTKTLEEFTVLGITTRSRRWETTSTGETRVSNWSAPLVKRGDRTFVTRGWVCDYTNTWKRNEL